MQAIQQLIARVVLHKYLPVQYIVKGWNYLEGYRTQIFAVLYLVGFELHKYHFGPMADDDVSKKVLEYLMGGASVTLLAKLQNWMPVVEEGITVVKEQGGIK